MAVSSVRASVAQETTANSDTVPSSALAPAHELLEPRDATLHHQAPATPPKIVPPLTLVAPSVTVRLTAPPSVTSPSRSERAEPLVAEALRALAVATANPAQGYTLHSVQRDELGHTHARFARTIRGLALDGEQTIVHFDHRGGVRAITGPVDSVRLAPRKAPAISTAAAITSATRAFGGVDVEAHSRLFAYRDGAQAREAYDVTVRDTGSPPRISQYIVDAANGAILDSWETARAATNARGIYNGAVQLTTTPVTEGYVLRDPTRGNLETRDARNQRPVSSKDFPTTSTVILDDDDQWATRHDDPRDAAAVDAQYAAAVTYDFLKDMFGRDSIDGKGGAIRSNVHAGDRMNGAFWLDGQVFYGDGDGQVAGPMVSLDFSAHEIMHGLTENTARLRARNEPGALNEASSDILSTGVRWWLSRKQGKESIDWWLGRQAWTPNVPDDAVRYMDHPTRDRERSVYGLHDRDNYLDRYRLQHDDGGVHMNAGIANNFFYLLVQGGTNDTSRIKVENGIGMEKALRIWYRALTIYLTPTSTFIDAREATLLAAADLYGESSAEHQRVGEAWTAVGVYPRNATPAALVTRPGR